MVWLFIIGVLLLGYVMITENYDVYQRETMTVNLNECLGEGEATDQQIQECLERTR